MAVARVKQNLWRESYVGFMVTLAIRWAVPAAGSPASTSRIALRFLGDKNFTVRRGDSPPDATDSAATRRPHGSRSTTRTRSGTCASGTGASGATSIRRSASSHDARRRAGIPPS